METEGRLGRLGRESRGTVIRVAENGRAEPQGVRGVKSQLMRASRHGFESDVRALSTAREHRVARDGRASAFRRTLAQPIKRMGGEGEGDFARVRRLGIEHPMTGWPSRSMRCILYP